MITMIEKLIKDGIPHAVAVYDNTCVADIEGGGKEYLLLCYMGDIGNKRFKKERVNKLVVSKKIGVEDINFFKKNQLHYTKVIHDKFGRVYENNNFKNYIYEKQK